MNFNYVCSFWNKKASGSRLIFSPPLFYIMSNSSVKVHAKPPFRAEHVGSLIRPRPLYEKRCQLEEGKCSVDELTEVEDDAVKHIVELQRTLGIRSITDGEVKK